MTNIESACLSVVDRQARMRLEAGRRRPTGARYPGLAAVVARVLRRFADALDPAPPAGAPSWRLRVLRSVASGEIEIDRALRII